MRLLKHEFRERFPDVPVFMDLDSIEAGQDFADAIKDAIGSSVPLVALIGRQWVSVTDEQGRRRLDDPDDFVRFELQTALERQLQTLPVLVDGAAVLRPEQLPPELGRLARLHSLELSYSRYDYDVGRLLDRVQRIVTDAPEAPGASRAPDIRPAETTVGGPGRQRPGRHDPARAARLFADAERVARTLDPSPRAAALSRSTITNESCGSWRLPTPTAPNASPTPSPRNSRRHRR